MDQGAGGAPVRLRQTSHVRSVSGWMKAWTCYGRLSGSWVRRRLLMHRLKYGGWHILARTAAELMLASPSCAEALTGVELIAPVPLHPWRQLRRGYNQSEKLAREIAILTGIQFAPDLAIRQRRTRSQTSLNPEARKRNVTGAFKVMDHTLCCGRSVCIVDDVMTTGATAGACAAALKDAEAGRVTALTFARA